MDLKTITDFELFAEMIIDNITDFPSDVIIKINLKVEDWVVYVNSVNHRAAYLGNPLWLGITPITQHSSTGIKFEIFKKEE